MSGKAWRRFEEFRDEQQAAIDCACAAALLLEDATTGERPVAVLRMAAPATLAESGPLAGWTLDVGMRLLGLAPAWSDEEDADGFGIVEQTVLVREPGGAERLVWRFGPNTGTLEIAGGVRGGPGLDGVGLPTGFVPLEEIIRVLIEGFGAPPRAEDWRVRLGVEEG